MPLLSQIIALGLVAQIGSLSVPAGPVVTTKFGKYRGQPINQLGVAKFVGIPYAKPPIGDLRFRPPELIPPHEGVFHATQQTPVCPQLHVDLGEKLESIWEDYEQSEDCLFLDVYVPTSAISDTTESPKRAVMVWIHGGGYIIGYKNYDASIFAGFNDVILVAINYRLGVLGFMSTQDENSVGNFGIRDQILALQWIQQNIEGFGGDKNRITIAGESAGAGSVTQLAITPASRGLFQRVIAQSGSAVAPWSNVADPLKHVTSMAEILGCPVNDSKELVECLRGVPFAELLEFQKSDPSSVGPKWAPVYDNELFPFTFEELTTNWENLAAREQLLHTDLMIGICAEEGAMMYAFLEKGFQAMNLLVEGKGLSKAAFDGILALFGNYLVPGPDEVKSVMLPSIAYKYTDWAEPTEEFSYTRMFVQFMTDSMFSAPGVQFARMHASVAKSFNDSGSDSPPGRTFFYLFNQTGSWMPTRPWRTGADHGDDIFFVFGITLSDLHNVTNDEVLFSKQMMTYWTNFVKTGDPNEPRTDKLSLPTWPRFELEKEKYMLLDKHLSEESVKTRVFSDRVEFWLDFIPKQTEITRKTLTKCVAGENLNTTTES